MICYRDDEAGHVKVLMNERSPTLNDFSKLYVYPGGKVELVSDFRYDTQYRSEAEYVGYGARRIDSVALKTA